MVECEGVEFIIKKKTKLNNVMERMIFVILLILCVSCRQRNTGDDNSGSGLSGYLENEFFVHDVKMADSLSMCGYKDLECDLDDSVRWEIFKSLEEPAEIRDIFSNNGDGITLDLEYSFLVYKYGLGGEKYKNYVDAVKKRHDNGEYPSFSESLEFYDSAYEDIRQRRH